VKKSHLVITAGPTIEPIDPVRVITNRSTGLMGYEIAKEALRRNYKVTLITGPTDIVPPRKAKVIPVKTARDMKKAVLEETKNANAIIMAAAVSDFRVKKRHLEKVKKDKTIKLDLVKNPDILKAITRRNIKAKIGFALESSQLLKNARKKLRDKNMTLIVANKVGKKSTPFGEGKKDFIILEKGKKPIYFKDSTKKRIAGAILGAMKKHIV